LGAIAEDHHLDDGELYSPRLLSQLRAYADLGKTGEEGEAIAEEHNPSPEVKGCPADIFTQRKCPVKSAVKIDSTGAVCSQPAGAYCGLSQIPPEWLATVAKGGLILEMALDHRSLEE